LTHTSNATTATLAAQNGIAGIGTRQRLAVLAQREAPPSVSALPPFNAGV
jgi:hypothetical protein